MAPKPRNTQPPVPPTTVPGKESGLKALLGKTPATTVPPVPTPTTTVPSTTPSGKKSGLSALLTPSMGGATKVGPVFIPRTTMPTPDTLEASKALRDQTRKAIQAGVPVQTVQDIVSGKQPEGKVEKIFNFDIIPGPLSFRPIRDVVAPSLGALQTGGRAVLSTLEEGGDVLAGLGAKVRGEEPLKYKATDYIPVHPQTGLPIAKTGDYYIRNWADVINTPIKGIENAKTPEEAKALQDETVKAYARSAAPSFGDIGRATRDFTYSASDIPYVPKTGNSIIDGIIDFGYDVAFDPVTYATFGGSALVKPIAAGAAKGATKASIKAAARLAADEAAADAAIKAAAVAADVSATAAEKAAAQAAADAAQKAADKAFRQAAAAAPRRVIGRESREALANNVISARITARQILDDAASTAGQKAVAQDALRVLTDEFVQDVAAKGYSVIRGEAARLLGVRNGARIGIPFGPKLTVPFTAKLTNFFGQTLAGTRFAVFKSEAGQRILNAVTPPGEGGLFGTADILKMRNALRTKSVAPEVAADYAQLLAADTRYRGILDLRRKFNGSDIRRLTKGDGAKLLQEIKVHLSTPEASWADAGLAPLTAPQRKVYDSVKGVLEKYYVEANSLVSKLGGGPLPKLPDYFPRVQSEKAIEWAMNNAAEAAKTAGDIGVDRTFFLGNFTPRSLQKGKVWFGNVLEGTETTQQLNEMARKKLGFDFFETDPVKALSAYANNHARYYAYADSLFRLTKSSPGEFGGLAQDVATAPMITKTGVKPSSMGLGSLDNTIKNLMSADRLQLWNEADVISIRSDLANLESKLAGSAPIEREAFQQALLELDEKIIATNRLIESGTIDATMGSLLKTEIEDYANALAQSIENTTREFLVTSPSRWQSLQRVTLDGFNVLNEKIVPNVAVREAVIEMFNNVKRLDDPAFVRAADKLLKDYTTFFKSYATLTPGFHLRNALSNTFMLLAAGGNPINLGKGLYIYNQWIIAQRRGQNIIQFAQKMRKQGVIKTLDDVTNLTYALSYSGATGFGQVGEIARAAGAGKPGIFGVEATGTLPIVTKVPGLKNTILASPIPGAKTLSQIAGAPIYGSRVFGEWLESMNRFMLTYDGLLQGFDAATAAARTKKYLIDYQDLSAVDRALRSIIPFWTWTSRNVPLQIENMWLNPKAYAAYDKFRNNLRDEENESPFLRQYRKEAGAFKLPFGENIYIQPDLGFPGAGQPSIVQQLFTEPEQLLSRLNPAFRVPLEIWKNEQFFSGAPVTDQRSADANFNKFMYALRQIGVPVSLLARYANATPLRRFELMQKIAGTKKVSDEQNARNQEINAGLSLFGTGVFKQLPSDERAEIYRRFFLLLEETEKAKFQKKEKEEK